MEIALAGKMKLGFITSLVPIYKEDIKTQELWDTCNNVVISSIHASLSKTIKKSILYC